MRKELAYYRADNDIPVVYMSPPSIHSLAANGLNATSNLMHVQPYLTPFQSASLVILRIVESRGTLENQGEV
jgi:hypothetical protein